MAALHQAPLGAAERQPGPGIAFSLRRQYGWQIESAFSMIKRKFGDAVRSKTPTAMAHEVLAKLVCHNVVCCIHEMHELGIDPGFGGEREEPREDDGPWLVRFPGA